MHNISKPRSSTSVQQQSRDEQRPDEQGAQNSTDNPLSDHLRPPPNHGGDTNNSGFPMYAQLYYEDAQREKPARAHGFDYIPLITSWFFFPPGHDREDIDGAVRERIINNAQTRMVDGETYMLDIEHWPTGANNTAQERAESVSKMVEVINIIRGVHPNIVLGYYSMVPGRNYWGSYENCLNGRDHPDWIEECTRREQEWHDANTELLPLAEAVDFIAPSVYTFYNDPEGWTHYARANIEEAQRLAGLAGGIPVYAYIWPSYHGSNPNDLGYTRIDGAFWRHQLEIVKQTGVDAAIIWDNADWLTMNQVRAEEWFAQTLDFMANTSNGQQDDGPAPTGGDEH